MHLAPLHNVLLTTVRLLDADAAALRLLPASGVAWHPLDVAVGDTALLQQLGWAEGELQPQPPVMPLTKALFDLPGSLQLFVTPGCAALRIDISDELLTALPGQFKAFEKRGAARTVLGALWFAIAYTEHRDLRELLDYPDGASSLTELIVGVATQTMWGLYQSRQALADPVTGLPGPEEFRARLRRVSKQADSAEIGLFLLGLDDYTQQRKRLGHEHAEGLLRSSARLLERVVRKDDALFSYREAQFAVIARVDGDTGGALFANKLLDALAPLQNAAGDGGVKASLGYLVAEVNDGFDPHALCLCAEQALDHARMSGGQRCVHFSGTFASDEFSQRHLVSSLLTDPERGYRNNYILWQTLALLSAETEPRNIAAAFSRLLQERFEAQAVMLIGQLDGGLTLLDEPEVVVSSRLTSERLRLVQQAFAERELQLSGDHAGATHWLAAPLLSRELLQGAVFIESAVSFDAADQIFLKALADQLAGALDRANLVQAGIEARKQESDALRAQLSDLQQQMPGAPKQIAGSAAMQSVLAFVQRVAPTDVSVLIMGESGVGKEVMAKNIHAASPRADAPMVVVDCSAITPSLIESELFGRVKGAFTGADEASEGRIAQADGGTLFLDEIGELPLDVQAKLLRFVQEKEVVAVGATDTRIIDTRILCATNRDLAEEVRKGRFRADLYYRLQAIQIEVPPLRQRPEDLPGLVEHFLHTYSAQFGRTVRDLSESAWRRVTAYPWPGNIRELQNVLTRAVLTAQHDVLDERDLRLEGLEDAQHDDLDLGAAAPPPDAIRSNAPQGLPAAADDEAPWAELQRIVATQIRAARAHSTALPPLGRWLADAVILTAWEMHDRVVTAAARTLGMAETTLRRQLVKARERQNSPLHAHSPEWLNDLPALSQALHRAMLEPDVSGCVAERCEQLMLREVQAVVGDDQSAGAALLGITPPTYARRLRGLEPADAQAAPGGYV